MAWAIGFTVRAARRILDFTVRRVIGRDDPRNTVKALKGGALARAALAGEGVQEVRLCVIITCPP